MGDDTPTWVSDKNCFTPPG